MRVVKWRSTTRQRSDDITPRTKGYARVSDAEFDSLDIIFIGRHSVRRLACPRPVRPERR